LKNNIEDKKILNFDYDINSFVSIVGNIINMNFDNYLLKRNVLDTLRCNNTIQEVGVYKNILVNVIDKSNSAGLEVIEINEDAERFYLLLKSQLYDYLSQSINDRKGLEYYKKYLSINISNYLEYDNNKEICNINVSKISELFRIIRCYNIIYNLCYFTTMKIELNRIDIDFVLKIEEIIKRFDTYNYSKEELNNIYLLYKHSVECSELDNLDKIFIKKRER